MDFITYKTRMRKKKQETWCHATAVAVFIQVPQVLSISCVEGIATAEWLSKYLTTVNPFLSNYKNDNLRPNTFCMAKKACQIFSVALLVFFLTRHGVFIQSIKLPEINPLFLFSWNLSNARMSPYNIFFINSVVHHQFRRVGNHYFNCRMK